MFRTFTFLLMIGLGLWVLSVTALIEVENASAGYYLPRHDFSDGKWRISRESTPRDKLRGLVSSYGLWQYFLAPLLLVLGIKHALQKTASGFRLLAVICCIIGVLAFVSAVYRGYLPSLDW